MTSTPLPRTRPHPLELDGRSFARSTLLAVAAAVAAVALAAAAVELTRHPHDTERMQAPAKAAAISSPLRSSGLVTSPDARVIVDPASGRVGRGAEPRPAEPGAR